MRHEQKHIVAEAPYYNAPPRPRSPVRQGKFVMLPAWMWAYARGVGEGKLSTGLRTSIEEHAFPLPDPPTA